MLLLIIFTTNPETGNVLINGREIPMIVSPIPEGVTEIKTGAFDRLPARLRMRYERCLRGVKEAKELSQLEEYIQSFSKPLTKIVEKLRILYPKERVMGNLKTVKSLEDKLSTGRFKLEEISDVGRTRAVFDNYDDLTNNLNQIRHQFKVINELDLINNPTDLGYRAHHFVVEVDGKLIEIQFQTKNVNILADSAKVHLFYRANQLGNRDLVFRGKDFHLTGGQFKKLRGYYRSMYEYAFDLDSSGRGIRPFFPEGLPQEFEILETFKIIAIFINVMDVES